MWDPFIWQLLMGVAMVDPDIGFDQGWFGRTQVYLGHLGLRRRFPELERIFGRGNLGGGHFGLFPKNGLVKPIISHLVFPLELLTFGERGRGARF